MADEIELKFKVFNYLDLVKRLQNKCSFVSSSYELTVMYDKNKELFEKDARLRLRKIVNLKDNLEKCEFSYKKPKSREGIKIEEEYETQVSNFNEIEAILINLGFVRISSYERIRDLFYFNNVKITIDSFPFGDYIEFEGNIDEIKEYSSLFDFDLKDNITLSCDDIYAEICLKNNQEVKNDIIFQNKFDLENQKLKRKIILK